MRQSYSRATYVGTRRRLITGRASGKRRARSACQLNAVASGRSASAERDDLDANARGRAGETEVTGQERAAAADREQDVEHIVSAERISESGDIRKEWNDPNAFGPESLEAVESKSQALPIEAPSQIGSPQRLTDLGVEVHRCDRGCPSGKCGRHLPGEV